MDQTPKTYEEFRRDREVPREPSVPPLNDADIQRITETVFWNVAMRRSHLIWVFGSSDGAWAKVADAYHRDFAPWVLVSGNLGKQSFEHGKPLAHLTRDVLVRLEVPAERILIEPAGNNTLDEVRNGQELLAREILEPASILCVCKSHHSGRVYRTLKKYFPAATLTSLTYDASYAGVTVRTEDWWHHPVARSRVYAEYLRIQLYSARGDIET